MRELFKCIWKKDWKKLFFYKTANGWIQLFRYGIVGCGAFVIDFSLYWFLTWSGLHYLLAGVIAFAISFLFNFAVSHYFVFQSRKQCEKKELIFVFLIALAGMLLTEILLFIGTDLFHMDFRISKIIATILVMFWNYFARKRFVYG